jgi:hypothetical protein
MYETTCCCSSQECKSQEDIFLVLNTTGIDSLSCCSFSTSIGNFTSTNCNSYDLQTTTTTKTTTTSSPFSCAQCNPCDNITTSVSTPCEGSYNMVKIKLFLICTSLDFTNTII